MVQKLKVTNIRFQGDCLVEEQMHFPHLTSTVLNGMIKRKGL